MRLRFLLALAALATACGRPEPPPPPEQPPRASTAAPQTYPAQDGAVAVRELVTGLQHPWGLALLPDGGFLVTERPGRLRRIGADGSVSAPIKGVPHVFVSGQAGLLDVVLSPTFAQDRLVYLSFAGPTLRGNKAGTAVARGRLAGDALEDVEVVFSQEPKLSSGTHVGSRIVFDRDGMMFVTTGDNRVAETSQDLDKLQGKIVRLYPDGRVPDDNPFVGREGVRPEIWSYGHRNVQGAALHPVTGALWTHEHGPMGGDEINLPAPGVNYGWPVITEGLDYSGDPVPGSTGNRADGMQPPHFFWAKSPAVSGMAFGAGDAASPWHGDLFVGALVARALIRLELDDDRIVGEERLLESRGERIRDVRAAADGSLYLLTDDIEGKLLQVRLLPSAAGDG